jgi:hypothetical protein
MWVTHILLLSFKILAAPVPGWQAAGCRVICAGFC